MNRSAKWYCENSHKRNCSIFFTTDTLYQHKMLLIMINNLLKTPSGYAGRPSLSIFLFMRIKSLKLPASWFFFYWSCYLSGNITVWYQEIIEDAVKLTKICDNRLSEGAEPNNSVRQILLLKKKKAMNLSSLLRWPPSGCTSVS